MAKKPRKSKEEKRKAKAKRAAAAVAADEEAALADLEKRSGIKAVEVVQPSSKAKKKKKDDPGATSGYVQPAATVIAYDQTRAKGSSLCVPGVKILTFVDQAHHNPQKKLRPQLMYLSTLNRMCGVQLRVGGTSPSACLIGVASLQRKYACRGTVCCTNLTSKYLLGESKGGGARAGAPPLVPCSPRKRLAGANFTRRRRRRLPLPPAPALAKGQVRGCNSDHSR